MSPTAYALNVANEAFARGLPAPRHAPMQALRIHLSAKLLDTAPVEGTPIEVLWCKAGTPGEVGEVWCPGTYLRTIGSGADKRYLVRSCTPRGAGAIIVPAAPESVRFVPQAVQR